MASFVHSEANRLAAVRRYDILDTPPDGAFDGVTQIAARLFSVPIALVTLVDEDRIWFKSRHGLDALQIDRDPGLCASAIMSDDVYTVLDARIDPRTLSNPLVAGALGLRFYAAAPLRTRDGFNLGTMCVIDMQPRKFDDSDKAMLERLAAIVMDEMELRLAGIKLGQQVLRERQLRQDLESANEELRVFGAAVSHDLRAPLNRISTLAGVLRNNQELNLNPAAHDSVEQMAVATRQMTSMLDGLHHYVRLSFQPQKVSQVDVTRIIKGLLTQLSPSFPQTRIHFEARPCVLEGDEVGLAIVLRNLIHNALKYSAGQQQPVVSVEIRSLPLMTEITVADNGIGISQTEQQTMFRLFQRSTLASTFEGTGVGLALVRKALDRMGGRLRVDSEPGNGTTFRLEFPVGAKITPRTA